MLITAATTTFLSLVVDVRHLVDRIQANQLYRGTTMKAIVVHLLCLFVVVVSADDPTVSLPGVHDLSESYSLSRRGQQCIHSQCRDRCCVVFSLFKSQPSTTACLHDPDNRWSGTIELLRLRA